MSNELLRRAAALLRERAEAATPGRWLHVDFAEPYGQPLTADGEQSTFMGCGSVITVNERAMGGDIAAPNGDLYPRGPYSPSDDMAWIATVDPVVGLAMADALDSAAEIRELHLNEPGPFSFLANMERLARAVLRESDEGSEQ